MVLIGVLLCAHQSKVAKTFFFLFVGPNVLDVLDTANQKRTTGDEWRDGDQFSNFRFFYQLS